jgi:hypothetical protein
LVAIAGPLLLLVAGCAQPVPPANGPADGGSRDSLPADAVALRVAYTGGFAGSAMLATRLPFLTVYGDGRVITEGPHAAIYPGPALPNMQVRRIAAADVRRLVDRATAAGVGTAADFGRPPIMDAASTRFTALTDTGVKTTEVYALNEADANASGLTEQQRSARAKLKGLLEALTDLPTTLGGSISQSERYKPTAVAAAAAPWQPDRSGAGDQREMAWPGPALPGKPLRGGAIVNCVTVTGDALSPVLAAAEKADTATPWTSGGKRWKITFRPLLPDETDCEDLGKVD